jgi:hypothetical protein
MDSDYFVAYRLTLYEMSSFDFPHFFSSWRTWTDWLDQNSFSRNMSLSYSSSVPYMIPEGWLLHWRETCYWILILATSIHFHHPILQKKKQFKVILSPIPTWSVWFLPFRCTNQNTYYVLMYAFHACCMFYPYGSAWIDSRNGTRPLWRVQILGGWEGGWVDDWCTIH